MDDLQLIQDELDQARRHLHHAQNAAITAGWTNDEAYALCTLARCADAVDVSLENRFTEGAYTYTPEDEVLALLNMSESEQEWSTPVSHTTRPSTNSCEKQGGSKND